MHSTLANNVRFTQLLCWSKRDTEINTRKMIFFCVLYTPQYSLSSAINTCGFCLPACIFHLPRLFCFIWLFYSLPIYHHFIQSNCYYSFGFMHWTLFYYFRAVAECKYFWRNIQFSISRQSFCFFFIWSLTSNPCLTSNISLIWIWWSGPWLLVCYFCTGKQRKRVAEGNHTNIYVGE